MPIRQKRQARCVIAVYVTVLIGAVCVLARGTITDEETCLKVQHPSDRAGMYPALNDAFCDECGLSGIGFAFTKRMVVRKP